MPLAIFLVVATLLSLLAGAAAQERQSEQVPPADLTNVEPLPLTGERRAAFEAYVADALYRFNVPGAAVAVVQDGNVVYLEGFGVKQMGGTEPVTPDTMMLIGSITKSMTTMLAASLVDDRQITWRTRLIDLLPDFAVGEAGLTERLTIHDAFCNCSGVPALNMQSQFESEKLTPQSVVTGLANVPAAAPFGQEFIYNNYLIASGGYALGMANGGDMDELGPAYDMALNERVLGPIGMARSTFDPAAVIATGDYALPHAVDLSGELGQLPLMDEAALLPYRPAGALWSNAREMALYLQTELAHGVAPNGTRVVSAENLEETWAPGVSVPNYLAGPPTMAASMTAYGLGWSSGDYHGLRVISHAGGSAGFNSEIAFLPDAGVGLVVLSNALSLRPVPLAFVFAIEFRLFELLFDQPAEYDAQLMAQAEALAASRPLPAFGPLDPQAVAPYLGRYGNAELGDVTVSASEDRLLLDAGGHSTELKPRADGGRTPEYLLHDPPLSLFSDAYGATVRFSGGAEAPRLTISIPASVTGPEQEFVFERHPSS